jgi:integrase
MESTQLVDCAGRGDRPPPCPVTTAAARPATKGSATRPIHRPIEEIISVMRAAGDSPDGVRLRGVIVVLWRAGLRISEALALNESDLDSERGAVLVRHGKGDKRREVGMHRWAWEQLNPWLELRATPGRVVVLRAAGPDPRSAVFGRRDPCPAPHRGSCRRNDKSELLPRRSWRSGAWQCNIPATDAC